MLRKYETTLTLNLLTTTIVAPPSNASKWQMGLNSAFKGLKIKAPWDNTPYINAKKKKKKTSRHGLTSKET
jgi:hypothetical protein